MPLSIMSALMLLVAVISGFIRSTLLDCKRNIAAAYVFLLLIVVLGRLEFVITVEMIISPAAIIFIFASALSCIRKRMDVLRLLTVLAVSTIISIFTHIFVLTMSHDAALLASGLSSLTAFIVIGNKEHHMILLACALSALLFELEKLLFFFFTTGYCFFEFGLDSLDRMMMYTLFNGFAHGIVDWNKENKVIGLKRA